MSAVRGRIPYLDGLRGVFSLSVAASHIGGSVFGWSNDRPLVGAFLAVDYFFMLSGFVLYSVASTGGDGYLLLFLKRFLRLWPLHVVTTCCAIVVILLNKTNSLYVPSGVQLSLSEFLQNVTFLVATGFSDAKVLNEPAWSISVEFWLSACILFLMFRLPTLIILSIVAVSYVIVFSFDRGTMIAHNTDYILSVGMYRGIGGMAIGGLMYRHQNVISKLVSYMTNWFCELTSMILLFVMMYGILFDVGTIFDAFYLMAFVPFLSVEVIKKSKITGMLLSSKIILWLGNISVSLYLLHTPIILFIFPRAIVAGYSLVWTGLFVMMIALILSTLSFRYFELPMQALAKRFLAWIALKKSVYRAA